MRYLFARLAEPSTWAGIGLFVAHLAPAVVAHDPVAIVGCVAGALAATVPERAPG